MEWIQSRNFLYPHKKNFLHFFCHGNQFYKLYLDSVDKKKCIDDDGSGEKPNVSLHRRMIKYSCFDPLQAMFDRDRRVAKENSGRKIKGTGCIHLPGSGFHEAGGHFSMSSCLQVAVINSAPRIGKYIDKQELYRQCPPRKVKDINISEI